MWPLSFDRSIYLGNFGRLRRAFVIVSENGRGHTDLLQNVLNKSTKTEERTTKIEEQLRKRELRESIERINILAYFPVTSLAALEDFLSNDDKNFKVFFFSILDFFFTCNQLLHFFIKEKKEEFETYLYAVCSMATDIDSFCAGLLKTLFRKYFIRDHRWPTTE